jgi:RimJ/RimL family protein N-acetyltransferase
VSTAWPLFALRVTTPRLTLRLPPEADLLPLAEQSAGRVVTPEQAGFMGPWTQVPSPEFERSFMQYHWAQRANWSTERWSLDLGIYPAGHDAPVGAMSMIAGDFARLRSAETGSWLLPEWRGQGLGREAREAMLHLLFEGLGAREARSRAHPDNAPSNAVSRALGYRPDGTEHRVAPAPEAGTGVGSPGPGRAGGDEPVTATRLLLTREHWRRRTDVVLAGLEECKPLFGLPSGGR